MRCGKDNNVLHVYYTIMSQPARMRCGKEIRKFAHVKLLSSQPARCAVAKATALYSCRSSKSSQPARMRCGKVHLCCGVCIDCSVATRTNALWQRTFSAVRTCTDASQPARMRCGKDCGVIVHTVNATSQPARMRCGKVQDGQYFRIVGVCRNPHECAVAKG